MRVGDESPPLAAEDERRRSIDPLPVSTLRRQRPAASMAGSPDGGHRLPSSSSAANPPDPLGLDAPRGGRWSPADVADDTAGSASSSPSTSTSNKRPRRDGDGDGDGDTSGWSPSPTTLYSPTSSQWPSPSSPPRPPPRDPDYSPPPRLPPVDPEEQRRYHLMFAEHAVRRHNKNRGNETKYSLVELVGLCFIYEDIGCGCTSRRAHVHMNLRVRTISGPRKYGHAGGELAFAELHYGKGLTDCLHIVGDGRPQFPGRRSDHVSMRDGGFCSYAALDMLHCYSCNEKILHPEGKKYKFGHHVPSNHFHLAPCPSPTDGSPSPPHPSI